MTTSTPTAEDEHLLVHQFIRLFGRRPSPLELSQYRAAQSRVRLRLQSRARRRLALMITRL